MNSNRLLVFWLSILWRIRKNPIPILKDKSNLRKFASYGGKRFFSTDEINNIISNAIENKEPMMLARFGANEFYTMWTKELGIEDRFVSSIDTMCKNAGFFPKNLKLLEKFSDLMIHEREQVDYLAVWNLKLEEYIVRCRMTALQGVFALEDFEPWYSDKPWTTALEGKKVVVVHPFAETIIKQYEKREKLFARGDILPLFSLRVVKAVQSIAGEQDSRFETWFEALEYMYHECLKEEFDVAIIGCGAYGFPLAAKIKKAGKVAIHMGGSTQLLFGIKGKRWDYNAQISSMYNDYWVRPSDNERPKNLSEIEEGCYW